MPLQGAIDIDRGVSIRQVVKFDDKNPNKFEADVKYGGMTVYMYKDEPGKYYNVHGKEIPEGMAALAGFPVEKLARARRKKEAMAAFTQELNDKLALELDEEVILKEDGDWKVVAMPAGRAKIVDKETGGLVTPQPMARKDAMDLLKHLTGTANTVKNISNEPAKE